MRTIKLSDEQFKLIEQALNTATFSNVDAYKKLIDNNKSPESARPLLKKADEYSELSYLLCLGEFDV